MYYSGSKSRTLRYHFCANCSRRFARPAIPNDRASPLKNSHIAAARFLLYSHKFLPPRLLITQCPFIANDRTRTCPRCSLPHASIVASLTLRTNCPAFRSRIVSVVSFSHTLLNFGSLQTLPRDLTEIPPRLYAKIPAPTLTLLNVDISNNKATTNASAARLVDFVLMGNIFVNSSLKIDNNTLVNTNKIHGFSKNAGVLSIESIRIDAGLKPQQLKDAGFDIPDALLAFNRLETMLFSDSNILLLPQSILISNNYFGFSDEARDFLLNTLPKTEISSLNNAVESISSLPFFFSITTAGILNEGTQSSFIVRLGEKVMMIMNSSSSTYSSPLSESV